MKKPSILMIDDDPVFLRGYQKVLGKDYQVLIAETINEGLKQIVQNKPDIVLLDISLNKEREGVEILPYLKEQFPYLPIILVTNWDSFLISEEAKEKGVDGFFLKSQNLEQLRHLINNVFDNLNRNEDEIFPIAVSHEMKAVFHKAKILANSDMAVALYGETGVGKEIVAHYIHEHSPRKHNNFQAINCTALPDPLLQSELFGFEKGAFTGALKAKKGLIEVASGGTLFLDEIKDLSLPAQRSLLRVLENKRVVHLGGTDSIAVDIRIISASQVPLKDLIKEGKFREDLFYRLAGAEIFIPPLRERTDDIPALIHYFLLEISKRNHLSRVKRLSHRALLMLKNYHWPGNVRELYATLEAAVLLSPGYEIKASDIQFKYSDVPRALASFELERQKVLANFEKDYLREALTRNKGNISRTAAEIGLSRQSLQKKIKKYGLS